MAKICPFCDRENPDTAEICEGCGASLAEIPVTEPKPAAFSEPVQDTVNQKPNIHVQGDIVQSPYAPPAYGVEPLPLGGLIAWSVIVILFCLIPGVVALVKVLNINKAQTYEEQMARYNNAKVWLIAGTVLGVLSLMGGVGSRMM